jgi:CRP-like cAMP-binding protein
MGKSQANEQNEKYEVLLSSSDPRVMTFLKGQYIFKAEEDACNGCWFLIQGRVAMLDADGKKISEISGLNLFGERAFILGRKHSCTAQAVEDSKVFFLGKEDFFGMVATQPEILDKLLKKWFGRLQQALDAIRNLAAKIEKLTEEKEKALHALRVLQNDLDKKDEEFRIFLEELSTAAGYVDFTMSGIPQSERKEVLKEAVTELINLINSKKNIR